MHGSTIDSRVLLISSAYDSLLYKEFNKYQYMIMNVVTINLTGRGTKLTYIVGHQIYIPSTQPIKFSVQLEHKVIPVHVIVSCMPLPSPLFVVATLGSLIVIVIVSVCF